MALWDPPTLARAAILDTSSDRAPALQPLFKAQEISKVKIMHFLDEFCYNAVLHRDMKWRVHV